MRQLKAHQAKNRDSLIESLRRFGGSLDASDTGTGKSTTFLAVCRALNAQPAIITRKAIIPAWRSECEAMGVVPLFITNYEAIRAGNNPYAELRVKKTNRLKLDPITGAEMPVEEVHKSIHWSVPPRVLFAFDEVQSCRGPASMNTQMLVDAASKYKTCMLSATPFTSPDEAYGIGVALRLFSKNGFYSWRLRHGVRKNPFGQLEFVGHMPGENHRQEGLKHMEAIHKAIFPERGVRTSRYEIPGFPDEITELVRVVANEAGEVEKEYLEYIAAKRQADYDRACEGVAADLVDLVQPLAVTLNLRARQRAEILKCASIVELARTAREKGESVAIFVNFDDTIEILSKSLKTDCIIRGDRKGENHFVKARWMREFQANRQPIILVNNEAGGAGLNLHDPVTQVPRTNLISPPWSAITLKQIFGRTQRLGGGFSTRKLLFTAGTVEEKVLARCEAKMNCLDMLTDGDLDVL